MGIVELLTVIFVVCKVFGIGVVADWTWLQVFIPQIIAIALYIAIALIALLCFAKGWKKGW